MYWSKLLSSLVKPPITFVATATTGIKNTDELLGITCIQLDPDKKTTTQKTILRNVPRDKLLETVQYHGITEDRMKNQALDDAEFDTQAGDLIKGDVFTYNPEFQARFIMPHIRDGVKTFHNLPLLWAGANAGFAVDTGAKQIGSFESKFARLVSKVPSFKSMCCLVNSGEESICVSGLESACVSLSRIWQLLDELEVHSLETDL